MGMNDLKNIKKDVIVLIILLVIIIGYTIYYFVQQSKIVIIDEENYYIETEGETDISILAEKWVKGYTSQYTQQYLKLNMKFKYIIINNVEILDVDNNIVQVDFTAKKMKSNSKYFQDWYEINNNSTSSFQWVLTFEIKENESGQKCCYMVKRQMPVQYQLYTYKSSGQEDEDLNYNKNVKKKSYDKTQYTYKIENQKLYVSYDAGNNWINVPVTSKELLLNFDTKNELGEGTYQISPEITAIEYNRGNVIYSNDSGVTWKKITISEISQNIMYLHFFDANNGIAIGGCDYAMHSYASLILKTSDAGATWVEVGTGPKEWLNSGSTATFINKSIGFILEPSVNADNAILYRTEDGGITFEKSSFPLQNFKTQTSETENSVSNSYQPKWDEVYDTPQLPELSDSVLTIVIGQGSDGNYNGGKISARYNSHDMGKTWKYVDQFIPESKEDG